MGKPPTVTDEEWIIYKKVMAEIGKTQKARPRAYYQEIVNRRWAAHRASLRKPTP